MNTSRSPTGISSGEGTWQDRARRTVHPAPPGGYVQRPQGRTERTPRASEEEHPRRPTSLPGP